MLIQPTLDALNRLKLHGMALALSEQMTNSAAPQLAFEERIALMLEREVSHRETRRKGRLWRACAPGMDEHRGCSRSSICVMPTAAFASASPLSQKYSSS